MFHQNLIVMAYMYSDIVFLILLPEKRSNIICFRPTNGFKSATN